MASWGRNALTEFDDACLCGDFERALLVWNRDLLRPELRARDCFISIALDFTLRNSRGPQRRIDIRILEFCLRLPGMIPGEERRLEPTLRHLCRHAWIAYHHNYQSWAARLPPTPKKKSFFLCCMSRVEPETSEEQCTDAKEIFDQHPLVLMRPWLTNAPNPELLDPRLAEFLVSTFSSLFLADAHLMWQARIPWPELDVLQHQDEQRRESEISHLSSWLPLDTCVHIVKWT